MRSLRNSDHNPRYDGLTLVDYRAISELGNLASRSRHFCGYHCSENEISGLKTGYESESFELEGLCFYSFDGVPY
jgi:hypothetical protein